MRQLTSRPEIAEEADRLLRHAGALGRLPTPVDDLVAAADLTEPEESMLSASVLKFAPTHLRDAVARLAGRVRGLVDRRALEVHLAPEVTHQARRNFIRLHETGHHILPWQSDLAYADDDSTLSPSVRATFELEASQCAADLLFQGKRFTVDAADLAIGLPAVIKAAEMYGASLRSGLRRYTETHRAAMVSIVLDPSPFTLDPLRYRRHEVNASAQFVDRFGELIRPSLLSVARYPFVALAAAAMATGEVVTGEWRLTDLRGDGVELHVDALATGYNVLVLAWVPISERTRRRVRLIA